MKIRNVFNYERLREPKNVGLSETIPDRSMSISEIMLRYARGQPLGGRADTYYDEDNEYDDFRDYDLTELAEMRQQHTENYTKLKKNREAFQRKLDKENADKAYYERLKNEGYEKNISKEATGNV